MEVQNTGGAIRILSVSRVFKDNTAEDAHDVPSTVGIMFIHHVVQGIQSRPYIL